MSLLTFKAARRSNGRWTVIVVDTGASALPPFFEGSGIDSTDAALLAALLNMIVKADVSVGDGETWKRLPH